MCYYIYLSLSLPLTSVSVAKAPSADCILHVLLMVQDKGKQFIIMAIREGAPLAPPLPPPPLLLSGLGVGICGGTVERKKTTVYSAYISWVFNFTNLESFTKFIQLKFEPLHCHTHAWATRIHEFFQQISSKQLFVKI